MKKKFTITVALLLVSAAPFIWSGILTVRGTGGWSTAGLELIPVAAVLLAMLWGAVKLLARLFRLLLRRPPLNQDSLAPQITLGIIGGVILGAWIGGELRMHGFELAAERAQPLVAAVEKYFEVHGEPPEELSELIPDYLSHIPRKLPPIEIVTDERALAEYGENSWALTALVSRAMMNWDRFIYVPGGNYPVNGFGGTLERVGAWAYVHE